MTTGDADIDGFLLKCLETMSSKGRDYTMGSRDRLHNFRNVGEFTGVHMSVTWAVYFYKHVSAVFSFIKSNGQNESEPIEERIKDCIVYLLLFYKMTQEMKSHRHAAATLTKVDIDVVPGNFPTGNGLSDG